MSLPAEQLQKILSEIELRAMDSQRDLQAVRQQIANNKRQIRLDQLTLDEIRSLPKGAQVWKGVGKTFVKTPSENYAATLEKQQKTIQEQISALQKKENYHETTLRTAKNNIEQILSKGMGS